MIRLIFQELLHRKGNFLLGTLSMAVAVGCLMASLAVLREHRFKTEELIASRIAQTKERLAKMEDDVRKITLKMGFNILILPKDQNLADLFASDYAEKTMPEEYAERLAKAGVATLNHILPSLQQKVKWTEKDRTVLLIGTRNEVYVQSSKQKPLMPVVKKGEMILGSELHRSLNLHPKDTVRFLGRDFKVAECKSERGNKDDITIWMDLAQVQEMLGKKGRVNAILALECNCESIDRLGEIRAEVSKILPDTQVIEYSSQALARAEARNRAAAEAQASLEHEKLTRDKLGQQKEELISIVVPLVVVTCMIWIGFMSWINVRERRNEIGILRVLGMGTEKILSLLLGRACLMGFIGGSCGAAGGLLVAMMWIKGSAIQAAVKGMLEPSWFLGILVVAPLMAMGSAWLPAFWAAQQDPATILNRE